MSIMETNEPTRPISTGITVVLAWDKTLNKSVFQRASFQVGSVGLQTKDYVGTRGNVEVDVTRLSDTGKLKLQEIEALLRYIWDEVKNNYENNEA